jgi:hypothetical protein
MKKLSRTATSDAARRALDEYCAQMSELIETLERAERAAKTAGGVK